MDNDMRPKNDMRPIHPGEILLEEFLKPHKISQTDLAEKSGLKRRLISQIIHEKRNITAQTARRLGKALLTSDQFWLNLQTSYNTKKQNG